MRGYQRTSVEDPIAKLLDHLGVRYCEQYSTRVGFVLDFYLPDYNGYIEADGPTHDTPKGKKHDRFRKILNERAGPKELLRIHHTQLNDMCKVCELICKTLGIKE